MQREFRIVNSHMVNLLFVVRWCQMPGHLPWLLTLLTHIKPGNWWEKPDQGGKFRGHLSQELGRPPNSPQEGTKNKVWLERRVCVCVKASWHWLSNVGTGNRRSSPTIVSRGASTIPAQWPQSTILSRPFIRRVQWSRHTQRHFPTQHAHTHTYSYNLI